MSREWQRTLSTESDVLVPNHNSLDGRRFCMICTVTLLFYKAIYFFADL